MSTLKSRSSSRQACNSTSGEDIEAPSPQRWNGRFIRDGEIPEPAITWRTSNQRTARITSWRSAVIWRYPESARLLRLAWTIEGLTAKNGYAFCDKRSDALAKGAQVDHGEIVKHAIAGVLKKIQIELDEIDETGTRLRWLLYRDPACKPCVVGYGQFMVAEKAYMRNYDGTATEPALTPLRAAPEPATDINKLRHAALAAELGRRHERRLYDEALATERRNMGRHE